MNDRQTNKISRSIAIQTFLNSHPEITSKIPSFAEAIDEHNAKLAEIQRLESGRKSVNAGKYEIKKGIKKQFTEMIFHIISAMNAFATITNNTSLRAETDFSEWDIIKMRDLNLYEYAMRVFELGMKYIEELKKFLITEANLIELKTVADNFNKIMGEISAANALKKNQTEKVKKLFAELDDIIYNKIDKFVNIFKQKELTFWQEYRNVRNIIDR